MCVCKPLKEHEEKRAYQHPQNLDLLCALMQRFLLQKTDILMVKMLKIIVDN